MKKQNITIKRHDVYTKLPAKKQDDTGRVTNAAMFVTESSIS